MLTSRHDPGLELQKAGHGCLVETQGGEWYLAHLVARPASPRGRCVLGRESAIQRVEWVDGWPHGTCTPSLLASRVTGWRCSFETTVTFDPATVHQSAGITAYYNSRNWYHLALTTDGLLLTGSDRGARTVHFAADTATRLGLEFDGPVLRFSYDGKPVPVELDATILSDEYADEIIEGQVRSFGFTGAFVGLWVQDLAGEGCQAVFEDTVYELLGVADDDDAVQGGA